MGLERPVGERVLAWIYTGPIGHLWSPVADIATLWTRWIAGRLRSRVARARG